MQTIYFEKNIPRVLATKFISHYWPDFVWTPFSSARVATVPDPPLPGPNWLRVRNRLCGICASDLHLLFVHADPSVAPAALPGTNRFYLGHEVVSIVVEVGSAVTRCKVGDRVIMDSRFAGANCHTLGIKPVCRQCAAHEHNFCENKALPGPRGEGGGFGDSYTAHETEVYPCPPDLTDDQAALVEPMACAVHSTLRRPPEPGERVLVVGAGIIGLCQVMAARAFQPDCRITAIARYPHQAEMARRVGANDVLTGREGYEGVAKHVGGKFYSAPLNKGIVVSGFDLIYDCVGNAETIGDSLRWTRAGGTVVVVGVNLNPVSIDLTLVWYHHVNLIGTREHGHSTWNGQTRHDYDWVIDFIRNGRFPTAGLITHRFPFADYKRAIATSMSKAKERAVKVVVEYAA
ncbi:MAG TPA: alcohol dehydrogenase catalytic domain-containing protein [Anaerolineales bacterium]|nr:alcohol dehydrogenase catalytic domain-containing protein [Anaerolineales bacterium]